MTATPSIGLTDEQHADARSPAASGHHPSLGAALQRGLDMVRQQNEMRDAEPQAPRLLIDRRRAGGFVDLDSGEAETRAVPGAPFYPGPNRATTPTSPAVALLSVPGAAR